MRLAIAGKGGTGKSVVAGTLARLLARRGERVIALDSDLLPGLSFSLGAEAPPMSPLAEAAEKGEDGRWRLRRGIGPVRAVRHHSIAAPDGIRLLQAGKLTTEGLPSIMGGVNAFYRVVHRLREPRTLERWALVGDLPAGPRQFGFDWAPYADTLVVLVAPTWQSALTARRIARIARARGGVAVHPVANMVAAPDDVRRTEQRLGEPVLAAIPADDDVVIAERRGAALIDDRPSAAAVRAVEGLIDRLQTA